MTYCLTRSSPTGRRFEILNIFTSTKKRWRRAARRHVFRRILNLLVTSSIRRVRSPRVTKLKTDLPVLTLESRPSSNGGEDLPPVKAFRDQISSNNLAKLLRALQLVEVQATKVLTDDDTASASS